MTTTQTDPRICACGCGQPVIGSRAPDGQPAWKRGHKLKTTKGKLTALPGPGDDLDAEDFDAGEAFPDDDLEADINRRADLDDDLPDWLLTGKATF